MLDSLSLNISTLPSISNSKDSDLPTRIAFKSICVSDLKFENQTNEATVSAGSRVYGRLQLNIQPKEHNNCLRQIIVGIKELGPQKSLLSEKKIIGKRLEGFMSVDREQKVYEFYVNYPKEFVIEAPNAPGLYELEVCLLELEGVPIESPGALNGFFKLSDKDEQIFESENALETLWNMNEHNCKISLGLIRVI